MISMLLPKLAKNGSFLRFVILYVCLFIVFLPNFILTDSLKYSLAKNSQLNSPEKLKAVERRPRRRQFYYELIDNELRDYREEEEDEDDLTEEEIKNFKRRKMKSSRSGREAFGHSEYLLPENFRSLHRKDIPVTYRLHDDLLRYYRKGTRPVTHPSKIINVSMSVFLYQIIKLDAVKNTISLSGSFEMYWQDEFLQWEPDTYEGATEIFLASTDIWIPEFSLYYSVNFNDAVKLQSNNDVRVNFTGHVRYWIPFSTESLCSMDVKFFPFDIQRCTLLLGSWAHSNDSIKYSLYSKNLSLIDFYDNQEWQLDLKESHITSDGFLYDYLDPPLFWEMIVIDLVVSRQRFYYVFNLVIPSAMINAKFRQGIMTLMSMSMILLAIVQDMPKFSMSERKGRGSFSGIPLIGLYYFMLLVIVSFSTVTTSMFVYMERNVRIHNRIPFYLRWLITFEKKKKQLSFRGISTKRRRAHAFENEATQIHSTITPPTHGHLNGFVGSGIVSSQQQLLTDDRQSLLNVQHRLSGSISNINATTQNVALSLLRLISCDRDSGSRQDKALSRRKKVMVEEPEENCQPDKKFKKRKDEQLNSSEGIKLRKSNSPIPPPPPSPAAAALSQRKRHSLLHAESPLVG
uniref:Neurotransmitter-gated ion-channel ligand-binding domain-containing protein n=1 Tax=Meloidogyne enterolobii TaxID=390850 RepID=A0A6V7W7Z7_MELEN|nr:unnamed protein product [Meloidogyne enterolobii]